jgi:enamine deaminase RidA (YjgF/YER057c/UK114 family)
MGEARRRTRYAQARRAGSLLFVSGQVARDPAGKIVASGDFAQQAEQVIDKLREVLVAEGGSLGDIVKLTGIISHPSFRDAYVKVLDSAFSGEWPAHTLLVGAQADPEELLEIEAIAVLTRE